MGKVGLLFIPTSVHAVWHPPSTTDKDDDDDDDDEGRKDFDAKIDAQLTPALIYVSFQNEEIGNFEGWESVLRRLKDGRQILKEYAEFLKQR